MLKQEIIDKLEQTLVSINELKTYASSKKYNADKNMNADDVVLRCNEILSDTFEFACWQHDKYIK